MDNRSRDEDELKDDVGPADDKANSGEDENNIESLMCEETIPGSPPSHSDLLAMAVFILISDQRVGCLVTFVKIRTLPGRITRF